MTKPVIIAGVVAILALGGGGYVLMNRDDDGSSSTSTKQSEEQAKTEEKGDETEASFASISASGKPQQCTFKYSGADGTGIGMMYSDGKGRGRMVLKVTTEKGNSGETNTLVTTDKAYTWFSSGSGQSLGFVYDKAAFENRSGSNTTTSTSGTDPSKNFTMSCRGWSVDESMLTPPSDINFTSFSVPS